MKKLYSKKLGGEAFALDAAQLDILKKAGYTVPSPEEVIADAAAVKIEPPEGARAYVVFDFKTGAFAVRTRTQTLTDNEVGGSTASYVTATTDYFFLLSEFEVFGSISYGNTNEKNKQAQYAYYSAGNSKIKYKHNGTSTAATWWLRSPNASNSNNFVYVNTGGTVTSNGAYYSLGFAPGFCV